MVEAALLLVGRVHRGEPDTAFAAEQELARWRAGPPERQAALETAERLWSGTDGSFLQASVPLPRRRDPGRTRRNVLGLFGASGLAALMWGGGRWVWRQPVFQSSMQTGHGEQRKASLPDGSDIHLAPHTQTRIVLYRDRREVHLAQGEMRFDVNSDPDRPFTVSTDWGSVRVLGTAFSVRARDGQMRVEVAEGRVGVWPKNLAGTPAGPDDTPPIVLTAGQSIDTNDQGLGSRKAVPADSVGAWRNGWLVFDDTPLEQVLAQWNDYLPTPLRLGAHPRLKQLRLSGSFPLRQSNAFLMGLPDMLPVQVMRNARGEVVIDLK